MKGEKTADGKPKSFGGGETPGIRSASITLGRRYWPEIKRARDMRIPLSEAEESGNKLPIVGRGGGEGKNKKTVPKAKGSFPECV